ncbi:MAG: protein kinase [Myxococcota bacterium]
MGVDSSLGATPGDIDVPTLDLRRAIAAARAGLLGDADHEIVRVGRYRIDGILGRGAMGIVYRAHDEELSRDVAIKVLNTADPKALVAEARSLARLIHPNVVAVYDVGTVEDDGPTRVYMVMELLGGGTLRQWLKTERSVEETVSAFVAAGRGLVAAHSAGLVHRDFKPANVLVGDDGRICVTDFGLAQADKEDDLATMTDSDAEARPGSSVASARRGLVGTPRYMAPEQHRCEPVTGAADQYALCTALYEAINRAPPFAGVELSLLGEHKAEGAIPPLVRPAPSHVERAVVRGLHPDPGKRHEDMATLLRRLEPRARWWPVWLAVAAITALLVAVTWPRAPTVSAGLCGGDSEPWYGALRSSVMSADGGAPDSEALARRTALLRRLDEKVARWQGTLEDACAAARDTAVAENTVACLARWQLDVRGLGLALGDPELSMHDHLSDVVDNIDDPAACFDGDLVTPPPPSLAPVVAAFRRDLALIRARNDGGATDVVEDARALVASGADLDYPPVQAEAKYELAVALSRSNYAEATSAYEEAAERLEATGHRRLAVRAAIGAAVEHSISGDAVEAERWSRHAEAALTAAPDPRARIAFMGMRAGLEADRGDLDASLDAYRQAVEIAAEIDPNRERYYNARGSMGWTQIELGDIDTGLGNLQVAVEIAARRYGADSSAALEYSSMLGVGLVWAGRDDAAAEVLLPVVTAIEDGRLVDSPMANTSLMFAATLHAHRGRFADARRLLERVLEFDETHHPVRTGAIDGLLVLAQVEGDAGNVKRALSLMRGALVEAQSLTDNPETDTQLAVVRSELAGALLLNGQYAEGLGHAAAARSVLERTAGRSHALTVSALSHHASLLLANGERDAALGAFAELQRRGEALPRELPFWTRFPMGAALYHLDIDRARGRELVNEALVQLEKTAPGSAGAYHVRTWIKQHLTEDAPDP